MFSLLKYWIYERKEQNFRGGDTGLFFPTLFYLNVLNS